ncbi:hypothetical protein, partial [Sphingomonas ursincola]|uniref:hypothetical protein n=1 Tax=Sphingomonas ursincola TaxID=56361 RepID=UPI0023522414
MRVSSVSQFQPAHLKGQALTVESFKSEGDQIIDGVLRTGDGRWVPIIEGVPSFLTGVLQQDLSDFAKRHNLSYQTTTAREDAAEQAKTNETFSDKWTRFKNYGL